ncbi:MAG: hypothetical protein Q7R80_01765 [bacterium]|nr:hypothetical protein [bacterium]
MARDTKHWGKDPRDHRRHQRQQPGGRALGVVAGMHGTVAAVREERDGRGEVRAVVTEERYELTVPPALKERVRSLFVKVNRVDDRRGSGRVGGRILVVTFHEPQGGIRGLPTSRAEERKLQKLGFTHVAIQWIPEASREEAAGTRVFGSSSYDERAFRIAWFKPRGGHQHAGEKGGEVVHEVYDELSVLQWIYENDLLALYDVPHLIGQGLLPKRDDDREAENGIAAQAQALFGRPMGPVHPERAFHRSRLLARLIERYEGDSDRALSAFETSERGKRSAARFAFDTFGAQAFYVSHAIGLAYAVFHLPNARFVLRVDLRTRIAEVEPMRVDHHGMDEMLAYDRFLTDAAFRRCTWDEFQLVCGGIGTTIAPAPATP